jgi:hypothetical protein
MKQLFFTALLLAPLVLIHAAEIPQKSLPVTGEVFVVQGRTAFLISPPVKPASGLVPWVW